MLNKVLFLVIRKPLRVDLIPKLLDEHVAWIIAAEQRGQVFMSGPFVGEGQPGASGGMTILRASNESEAREIAHCDPFVKNGAFDAQILEWRVMEGSLTFNVNLSTQHTKVY